MKKRHYKWLDLAGAGMLIALFMVLIGGLPLFVYFDYGFEPAVLVGIGQLVVLEVANA